MSETTGIKPIDYMMKKFGLVNKPESLVNAGGVAQEGPKPLTELQDSLDLNERERLKQPVSHTEIDRIVAYRDRANYTDDYGRTQNVASLQSKAKDEMDGADPDSQEKVHRNFRQEASIFLDQKQVEAQLQNFRNDLHFILEMIPQSKAEVDKLTPLIEQLKNSENAAHKINTRSFPEIQAAIDKLKVRVVQRVEAFLAIPEAFLSEQSRNTRAILEKLKTTKTPLNSEPSAGKTLTYNEIVTRVTSNFSQVLETPYDYKMNDQMKAAEEAFSSHSKTLLNGDLFTASRSARLDSALKQLALTPTRELVKTIDMETRALVEEAKKAAQKLLDTGNISPNNREILSLFINTQEPPLITSEVTRLINDLEKIQVTSDKETLGNEVKSLLYERRSLPNGQPDNGRSLLFDYDQRTLRMLFERLKSSDSNVSQKAISELQQRLPDLKRNAEANNSLSVETYDQKREEARKYKKSERVLIAQLQGLLKTVRESLGPLNELARSGGDTKLKQSIEVLLTALEKGEPHERFGASLASAFSLDGDTPEFWYLTLFKDRDRPIPMTEVVALAQGLGLKVETEAWRTQLENAPAVNDRRLIINEKTLTQNGDMLTFHSQKEKEPLTLVKMGNVVVVFHFESYTGQMKLSNVSIDSSSFWHDYFEKRKFTNVWDQGARPNPFPESKYIADEDLKLKEVPSLK